MKSEIQFTNEKVKKSFERLEKEERGRQKIYKLCITDNNSNLWIVSMSPGDLRVAGRLFSFIFWGNF